MVPEGESEASALGAESEELLNLDVEEETLTVGEDQEHGERDDQDAISAGDGMSCDWDDHWMKPEVRDIQKNITIKPGWPETGIASERTKLGRTSNATFRMGTRAKSNPKRDKMEGLGAQKDQRVAGDLGERPNDVNDKNRLIEIEPASL